MAELTKFRLVRCPRCDKILAESPHFSVYRCGGCSILLQAQREGHLGGALSGMSSKVRKDEDQPKINAEGESFSVGPTVRSFVDSSRWTKTTENGRLHVSINGCFIPEPVVKKAEKLAGPIQAGEYWYDFQAGFWGVIGHPCLGIIPPNIEEFKYPMALDCSGGNTGVLVNGRELHQKDLDLLAGRGLPTKRDKSYLIDVSGRVVDEHTGEELDSLGRLAPTMEKIKHGFGMRVPKSIRLQRTLKRKEVIQQWYLQSAIEVIREASKWSPDQATTSEVLERKEILFNFKF